MNALGYVRVSTDRQDISPLVQERAIRAYCEMRGMRLLEILSDVGVSGTVPLAEREEGCGLVGLKDCAVVSLKLDRLFRDAEDCLRVTRDWEDSGVVLHIVDMGGNSIDTTSAAGRFMLTVLAGAAEMERNLIAERTTAALAQKRLAGEKTGGRVPLGKRVEERAGVKLLVDDSAQWMVAQIRALRGVLSVTELVDLLGRAGLRTANGACWGRSAVWRVCR